MSRWCSPTAAGCAVTGTVTATSKSTLTVVVEAVTRTDRPGPEITVVQAIPKGDRAELAVEVLTEIGVDRIVPWAAARCVGVWRGERAEKSLAKWRATAREAGKQSRRVVVARGPADGDDGPGGRARRGG